VAAAPFFMNLIDLRPTDRRPHHAPARLKSYCSDIVFVSFVSFVVS
jgi:hypothetical protein